MATTYFLRLEGRTTTSDLDAGVEARVYDPLWMLGRQWQLGELLGDDAGSPVSAALDTETAMLGVLRRGENRDDEAYDPRESPLEVRVEADQVRSADLWTLRLRIDTGRAFQRALDDASMGGYGAGFCDAFALDRADVGARIADPAGARLRDVHAGRVPDGRLLYQALEERLRIGKQLPSHPAVAAADTDAVRDAAAAWLRWCDDTLADIGGASAWRPATLDHGFSVATSSDVDAMRLDAPEHPGGALDWHAFNARPVAKPVDFRTQATVQGLPTGVRFRGMPNARWWEFEDASIDLGSVDAGASDMARVALLEFGLVYANDFFAMPLRLALGTLCRITSLVVADTFGLRQRIGAAAHGNARQGAQRWSMFTLSERDPAAPGGTGVSDCFVLPPVAHQILVDAPVEEVLLLRDEMANLAWAIERRYEGARGTAVERVEEAMRDRDAPLPPAADAALKYVLGTQVPPYWFPLVPVNTGGDLQLELRQMVNRQVSITPLGRLLNLNGPTFADANVPREGRQLVRDYVLTRWSNGATFVWSRRLRRVGRGEGSSGLRFDAAEPGG